MAVPRVACVFLFPSWLESITRHRQEGPQEARHQHVITVFCLASFNTEALNVLNLDAPTEVGGSRVCNTPIHVATLVGAHCLQRSLPSCTH
eukprot:scaffold125613_cov35-Tisochrysis_lutea.AAC.2